MNEMDTIRPVWIFRLLGNWLKTQSYTIEREHCGIETNAGRDRVDLADCELRASKMCFGLRTLQLTARKVSYTLFGVPAEEASLFASKFSMEVKKAMTLRRFNDEWPKYQLAYDKWVALESADRYLAESNLQDWRNQTEMQNWKPDLDETTLAMLPPDKQKIVRALRTLWADLRKAVDERNAAYAHAEFKRFSEFFKTVEKNPLTDEQMEAVVCDEDNTLVIAGAGCGKTSTIVGKVGYIREKGLANAEEILLLAFTRTAAREMRERLRRKFPDFSVQVQTFHSLGMEIIKQASGKKPSVSRSSKDPKWKSLLLDGILADLCSDITYLEKLFEFLRVLEKPYKSLWDFENEAEYRAFLMEVEPRTLQGELTASYEECEIANWLTLRNVRYVYEMPYRDNEGHLVDTATDVHRQYMPDFYLPDFNIYIEHWGVDRNERAPDFMNPDRYRDKMVWARRIHEKRGTALVETFSWERMDGVLLTKLKQKLVEKGVPLGRLSVEQAIQNLREKGQVNSLVNLLGAFLSLMKAGNMTVAELRRRIDATTKDKRQQLFLDLFEGVCEKYEEKLLTDNQIDFDDMISGALKAVQFGEYVSLFRYIIIDEFQDIGRGRADLIKALRNNVAGSKLYCVGDDWQSIYRFTGSDISLMTEFSKHFGYTREIKLTQTFRFNNKISEFSTRFILKNQNQISKALKTDKNNYSDKPQVLIHWRSKENDPLPNILAVTAERDSGTVYILNRYKYQSDKMPIQEFREQYPRLTIEALTAHASKGLEADYVIIDNLCGGIKGFPCGISDDPVLELVLPLADRCAHGEERRLFYVALTRAKKRVHLIADVENESPFIQEILTETGINRYDLGEWGGEANSGRSGGPSTSYRCPKCGHGHIQKFKGSGVGFYGCSYRPICDWEAPICPKCRKGSLMGSDKGMGQCHVCGHRARICPLCGKGALVERPNRWGEGFFNGCSRWQPNGESCKYREQIVIE